MLLLLFIQMTLVKGMETGTVRGGLGIEMEWKRWRKRREKKT